MAVMWGRNATVRRLFAALLVLSASCGGRSARHVAGDAEETGGRGGSGEGAAAGTGGAAGTPAGAGGSGDVLRPCGSGVVPVEAFPTVMVVLDASASTTLFAADGTEHWHTAQTMTLALLETLRPGVRVGVAVAQESDAVEFCSNPSLVVPPRPLDDRQRRSVQDLLERVVPAGVSPLLNAYVSSLDLLESGEDDASPAAVVVLGSGLPGRTTSCESADPVPLAAEFEKAVAVAETHGIDTFAIGFSGTGEERNLLSSVAIAGGTAPATCDLESRVSCYFDLTEAGDTALALANALRDVALRSPSVCSFSLDDLPSERVLDPNHVNFSVLRDRLVSVLERFELGQPCSVGWQFSEDERRVILCPDTCEGLRNDPAATLEIHPGCDGPPPRN